MVCLCGASEVGVAGSRVFDLHSAEAKEQADQFCKMEQSHPCGDETRVFWMWWRWSMERFVHLLTPLVLGRAFLCF